MQKFNNCNILILELCTTKDDLLFIIYEGEKMKAQKIISIITIVISLVLIAYMSIVMITDSKNNPSPNEPVLSAPTQTNSTPVATKDPTSGTTADATAVATPTPTLIPNVQVTANPGGKTSTNPNYYGKKIISITFDDGPHSIYTPKLLDMLAEKDVDVTFFVLGQKLAESSSQLNLLKRAYDEGHEIASHTYSHPNLKNLSASKIQEEFAKTDALIEKTIGKKPILFRPPYGSYNQAVSEASGKAAVLWSIDSRDWDHISNKAVNNYADSHGISVEEASEILINEVLFEGFTYTSNGKTYTNPSIVSQLCHGSIILFHDIHPYSWVAVEKLIDYLNESGEYVIMPVGEMIETEQRPAQAGDVYAYMWETYATQKKNW